VLAGQLNKQLVAAIGGAGQPAIGLCGGDLRMVLATKKSSLILATSRNLRRGFAMDPALLGSCVVPVVSSLRWFDASTTT